MPGGSAVPWPPVGLGDSITIELERTPPVDDVDDGAGVGVGVGSSVLVVGTTSTVVDIGQLLIAK